MGRALLQPRIARFCSAATMAASPARRTWPDRAANGSRLRLSFSRLLRPPVFFFFRLDLAPNSRSSRPAHTHAEYIKNSHHWDACTNQQTKRKLLARQAPPSPRLTLQHALHALLLVLAPLVPPQQVVGVEALQAGRKAGMMGGSGGRQPDMQAGCGRSVGPDSGQGAGGPAPARSPAAPHRGSATGAASRQPTRPPPRGACPPHPNTTRPGPPSRQPPTSSFATASRPLSSIISSASSSAAARARCCLLALFRPCFCGGAGQGGEAQHLSGAGEDQSGRSSQAPARHPAAPRA